MKDGWKYPPATETDCIIQYVNAAFRYDKLLSVLFVQKMLPCIFTTVVQQTDVDDRWENDAERPAATGLQLCSYQGFVIQIASDAIITRYKDNIHSSCWLGRHETSVPITSICNLNILLSDIRLSTFLPRPELRGWRGLPPRLRRSASSCGLLF